MNHTVHAYPALIDGKEGDWGINFPDLPGTVAMGKTIEEALANAEEVLRDTALAAEEDGETMPAPFSAPFEFLPEQKELVKIPLINVARKAVRANMMINPDVLALIDTEAKRRGMTRTSYVEWASKRALEYDGG